MESDYTLYNKNSIQDYPFIDDTDDAVMYVKDPDSFRSFDQGLVELLQKKNYPGNLSDINEMADYLFHKLKEIGSTIGHGTIVSWLSGEHRPKVEAGSRPKIYELCFAMHLTFEETIWFFQHVYYDRAFNCHNIREAVYYYAFLHQLSYQQAQEIIGEIEAAPETASASDGTDTCYTHYIQDQIANAESVDAMKDFLIANKADFKQWNKSALYVLNDFVSQLICPAEGVADIDRLRKTLSKKSDTGNTACGNISINVDDYQHCGLLVREILFDAPNHDVDSTPEKYILGFLEKRNLCNNSFILDRLVCDHSGMKKIPDVPYIVRNNFPSKKTMSDILSEEKISVSTSYDSIRKLIILLHFYCFWLNVKLGMGYTDLTPSDLTETYIDEANACLIKCGYEELFPANPYDWLFLCSAASEEPIEYFCACITPDSWTDKEDF